MIVGIDETGDFDHRSDKQNYFTAVLIDQNKNKFSIKESQFNIWESSIPSENRDRKGEAKGQKLTDKQLQEFYDQVLKPEPKVLYSVVRFNARQTSKETLDKHKEYEIKEFERVLEYYKKEARGNWAQWYQKIIGWYKNRNYQHIIKLKCLEMIIGQTLNYGFPYSQLRYILDKDEKNITNFSFKIDKDFILAENVQIYWTELLRNFWIEFSSRHPLRMIDLPDIKEFPEIEHYKYAEKKSNFKKVFRDRTSFLCSEDHFEIRMADIIGTILHRYQNKNRCEEIAKKILSNLSEKRDNYRQIALTEI